MAVLAQATRLDEFSSVVEAGVSRLPGNSNYSDQTYVTNAFGVGNSTGTESSAVGELPFTAPPAGSAWFHAMFDHNALNSGADGALLKIVDASGNDLALVDLIDGSLRAEARGTGGNVFGTAHPSPEEDRRRLDLNVVVSGGTVSADLYVNEQLVSSASTTDSGVRGSPASLQILSFDNTGINSRANVTFSEVIVADEPTLFWRLTELLPTANGHYAQFTGGFADAADDADTTFLTSDTANQKSSFTVETFAGTRTGMQVKSVKAFFRSRANSPGVAPDKMQGFLRAGGTDYPLGSSKTNGLSFASFSDLMAVNPASGAAWTFADLDGIEFGLESKA